ncbi:beta-ketoacyl synthase N-terminal-like domain-containing protein [Streptomyces longispororuber]|uniref:beta-ketoacyl synthase N-terminal-like domain-containing protein n=1 Tax=Streptomyces longispororuber TaxID=68230 RepID=UPI00210EDFE1|nr:beta-ketoacyl synthase N-terminal-like domain-containing protein [Streptomyces longispororuber]MCQ4213975.1 KR domain-containing protein [Streptomyces longispororuber]
MSRNEWRSGNSASGTARPDVSLVRRAAVDLMVFAPQWTHGRIDPPVAAAGGPRTFLVPPSQTRLHQELTERFPRTRVLRLDGPAVAALAAAPAADEHLVFVSRTSWADGISDADHTAFLDLVHALDRWPRVRLDVFTDKAVHSPLFTAATHPADGVYVGLAQALAKERPDWSVRCFCLADLTAATLAAALDRPLPTVAGAPVCVRDDAYAVASMEPAVLPGWPEHSAFRTGGTYVVLGGTGGLGGLLAEYLAAEYRAEVVVIGRRAPADFAEQADRLRESGARAVHYHQVDLADAAALKRALDGHEVIHGVVHSALVLQDATLATMSGRVLGDVLRPKLHGTHHLVDALRGRQLDFCLFFSSVQAHIASAGQGNYAAACVAKDAYADLLHQALLIDAKVVNWGYWGEIGVVAKPEYRERMQGLGIGSIEPAEGLAVIERFLAGDDRRITCVKGTEEALERMGITPHKPAAAAAPTTGFPGVLTDVVPVLRDDDSDVARNRDLSERLEAYTRWRLRQVPLPATAIGKYALLTDAIAAMPAAHSLPRAELLRDYPELSGHITLLDRCLDHLPDVLSGAIDAVEVLFPDGSFDLVAPVYQSNPIADYFNRICAEVVTNYQRRTAGRPLRVLEIGAGTGSTTKFVLPRLDPRDVSYHFTDLSYAFLHKARDAFGDDYPYVSYEICNIDNPPEEYTGSFDVVVATNVLHATANVPGTLRNVRKVLREGGILVLNEITTRQDYATLTFGLTDGWWLSNDPYRIEHSPLLGSDQWQLLMHEAGFGAVRTHGGEGQQVLVALAGAPDEPPATATVPPTVQAVESAGDVRGRVEEFVREVIAGTMRLDVSEVELDRPFRDMGIDSLISMELLKPLRERVGYVPATVWFEYPTVARLVEFLVTEHADTVAEAFPGPVAAAPVAEPAVEPQEQQPDRAERTVPVVSARPEQVARPDSELTPRPGDIAVVGVSARLPGAANAAEFWDNLFEGLDCTSTVPPERFRTRVADGPDAVAYTERGAFIDDIDAFDHTFFSITPREAARMDPQERLVLEQTYLAILDSGHSRAQLAGSDTGVFVGVMNGGYAWHTTTEPGAEPPTSTFWSMANRASYHFDWHGPSMAVDTACSASLTALHLACQSLRTGECDRAVVNGVNLITHPRQYQLLCGLEMLSRTGECRPFGAGADGFVDGEGVISLVLRPAEDALRDGDRVYAVISGSAVNAGGRANGYTAPNPEAQYSLVTKALAAAGTAPEEVGYVEAHGTGTALGDPIELRALTKAYAAAGTQRIRLGSVKSNIGHLESAAGLSGVLKAVLQMRHGSLVPSLHAERTNPHLDFADTPFKLSTQRERWPADLPLVSAVSSFGAGGANAHVVLRGVPERTATAGRPRRDTYVIPLSHHTGAGLQLAMDELAQWLRGRRVDMDALAHTLACRRDAFAHRVAIVCRDQDELVRGLEQDLSRRSAPRAAPAPAAVEELSARTAHDIAALYESGGSPDWAAYYPRTAPADLPAYPFLRHRHWIRSEESGFHSLDSLVSAHRIDGVPMAPAAWTLAVLAGRAEGRALGNVLWQKPITDPAAVEVRERGSELSIVDRATGDAHCTAEVTAPAAVGTPPAPSAGGRKQHRREIYDTFRRLGYDYGEPLRGVRWAEVGPGAVRAFLHVDRDWGYGLSPALLDCGMQLSILLAAEEGTGGPVFVPYVLGRLTVVRAPRDEAVYGHCVARPGGSQRTRTYDFFFTDEHGDVLVALEEVVSVAVGGGSESAAPSPAPAAAPFTVTELN